MNAIASLDRRFYPAFQRNWDDQLFRQKLLAVIDREAVVLDLGAGAGIVEAMDFTGHAARICGVDLDPRVTQNPYLDEGKIADASQIPYANASFDIVFADNVMEHIQNPPQMLAEVARVLKPGGRFLFKTPNKNHYMPVIARLTPHSFHRWINSKRGRNQSDTFPTLYRCNSPSEVRALAKSVGLTVEEISLIEGRPEYLRMSAATYLVGLAYERLVNLSPALANMRILMIASLRKPARA